jgi:hypothetical protein
MTGAGRYGRRSAGTIELAADVASSLVDSEPGP